MAVKLRLTRRGRKKVPIYRLVAAESKVARDSKVLEVLAGYNPSLDTSLVNFNEERVRYWLSVGAQPTETVQRLLAKLGVLSTVEKKSQFHGISKKDRKDSKS